VPKKPGIYVVFTTQLSGQRKELPTRTCVQEVGQANGPKKVAKTRQFRNEL